jgi:pimeloyl-ACP methyl ester carboxylesterase
MYIDKKEYKSINHCQIFISIRAVTENLPLMIYLHGGPGDAAYPLVLKYNQKLEEAYTVVIIEQRGSGKSYYPFKDNEMITIDTFVEDTYQLIHILLKEYHQQKVYIIGHSWGSVIGLKLIKKYPQIVHKYIGCGQVVNMIESSRIAYEFALSKNRELGNEKIIQKLESIDYHYQQTNWFKDLLFVTGQVVKHKGSLYGKSNYHPLIKHFLFSSVYSIRDIINRQKGARQSILKFWPELMTFNFESELYFEVPIIFIEGKYDFHVSSKLCEVYFKNIKSPKAYYEFEKSAHFPQWSESEKFNQIVIDLLI